MSLEGLTFPELDKRPEIRHINCLYVIEFARICRKNNLPIIEVGSGDAKIARWMMDHGHIHPNNMICVDPNPASYTKDKQVLVLPKYPTIKELITEDRREEKNIIGNCALLIIRPSTDFPSDKSCYVLEALEKLSPKIALILYRADGADGSSYLHHYFSTIGAPSSNLYDPVPLSEIIKPKENKIRTDYKTVSCLYTKEVSDTSLLSVPACLMLTTFDISKNCLPIGELNPNPPTIEQCKTLMLRSQLGVISEIGKRRPGNEECVLQ